MYLLASKKYGTLYIGMTNDLIKRVYRHKEALLKGFTEKYDVQEAIKREKQIKKWNRDWKIKLLEKNNPDWLDLYYELLG